MRLSSLFGTTLRKVSSDMEFESHGLLLRAGYVRQLGAGIFSYLPLAWRSMRKIEQILREEMERIGSQELCMPVVHPAEPWQRSGRWYDIDESMVRFTDRGGSEMVLAMTHEEIVATLAHSEIETYRQLPVSVFQMQTKFRDEKRSRGGLIRVREFVMKDSYSLDTDKEGLRLQYANHYSAYVRIGVRTGVPLLAVRSDTGMMGGDVAHEFMYITPIGEDSLAVCDQCGYAANRDVARFQFPTAEQQQPSAIEKVHTPSVATIDDLSEFLGVSAHQCAKTVCFVGEFKDGEQVNERLVVAVVRGDMEVNETRVQNFAAAHALREATAEEMAKAGLCAGFCSPIGIDRGNQKVIVLVDDAVAQAGNLIAGANESDYHFRNVNYNRDFQADRVGQIASVFEGAGCPECGSSLSMQRGVEVGNIFQLGTKYSESLDACYTDSEGTREPIVMGSYGIGVGRLLACAAEEHHDDAGLCLPISIAPFQIALLKLGKSDEVAERAEKLYQELMDAGLEVLFDDRELRPGVKFADSELMGIPIRVVISDRSLKESVVEVKLRTGDRAENVSLSAAVDHLSKLVQSMLQSLQDAADNSDSQIDPATL